MPPDPHDKTASRVALIMMNGGLGNGLILAPLLAELERRRPRWTYFTAPNAVLEADWVREPLGMRGAAGTFPPLWRRFAEGDRGDVWRFADEAGVDLVINLRKELARDDGDYFAFREQARERGIECWDLHELDAHDGRLRIGEQAATVLRRHGLDARLDDPAWLSGRRRPRRGVAGCYVGASTAVKRWAVGEWSELAVALQQRGFAVEAGAGPEDHERLAVEAIRAAQPSVEPVACDSLERMRDWIASLDVLVSNDTVAVHLAAALGCPVVVLYLATDGEIWAPVTAPRRLGVAQSALALSCSLMKADGTCERFYLGCPAPCHAGVRPAGVLHALGGLDIHHVDGLELANADLR